MFGKTIAPVDDIYFSYVKNHSGRYLKNCIFICVLLLNFEICANFEWKTLIEKTENSPAWCQTDVYYNSVEDRFYKANFHFHDRSISLFHLDNDYWISKTINVDYYPCVPVDSSMLFNEPLGIGGVPFISYKYMQILKIKNINNELKSRTRCHHVLYAVNCLYPGLFFITYNTSESITGSQCYSANSHALFFDGEKMHNYDHLWDSDWTASPMVWDERRNVVVKYGVGDFGTNYFDYFDGPSDCGDARLREWDGTTWTLRLDVPEPHPPKRMQRMVYDEARGVIILLHIFAETWEYDGHRWKNLTQQVGYPGTLGDRPQLIYNTAYNRVTLLTKQAMWALEDDATTQTYSRRNVMEEGCEMRQWGETGVDCSFTSSTSWSRIIVVKTEDGTAPMIGDLPTSGIWSTDVLWEIKTNRPPDPVAAESTGTLVSISYTPEMTDRITTDAANLKLYVARPDIPVGVPISDTLRNNMRTFEKWHSTPALDHEPLPGEYGVYNDIQNRRFLLRITMEEPFYGSPSGLPREDGEPASLCYAIGTESPDILRMLKNAILDKHTYTKEEKSLMDQNADASVNAADVVKILNR